MLPLPSHAFYVNYTCYRDSFGYDCGRRKNLAVLDHKTLLYVTGNLLHFLDLEDSKLSMRRSVGGSGISCMTVWRYVLNSFVIDKLLYLVYIEVYSWLN